MGISVSIWEKQGPITSPKFAIGKFLCTLGQFSLDGSVMCRIFNES